METNTALKGFALKRELSRLRREKALLYLRLTEICADPETDTKTARKIINLLGRPEEWNL